MDDILSKFKKYIKDLPNLYEEYLLNNSCINSCQLLEGMNMYNFNGTVYDKTYNMKQFVNDAYKLKELDTIVYELNISEIFYDDDKKKYILSFVFIALKKDDLEILLKRDDRLFQIQKYESIFFTKNKDELLNLYCQKRRIEFMRYCFDLNVKNDFLKEQFKNNTKSKYKSSYYQKYKTEYLGQFAINKKNYFFSKKLYNLFQHNIYSNDDIYSDDDNNITEFLRDENIKDNYINKQDNYINSIICYIDSLMEDYTNNHDDINQIDIIYVENCV